MNNNDIKILIGAQLDLENSIKDINRSIQGIQKKIDSVKLNIEIDNNTAKTLNAFSKAMENQKKINQDLNRVIKEEKVITKELDGTIKENIRLHLKNNEVIIREIERRNQKNKVVQQEAQNIKGLTEHYSKLTKEVERFDRAGQLIGKSSTFLDPKGNSRTINTDNLGNVVNYKDIENLEKFEKLQVKVQGTLNKLAQTGKYAATELDKIGKGINTASSISELNKLNERLNNLKVGDSLSTSQDKLRASLKSLYDQGKVNEQFFKNFNKSIDSTKNVDEIKKVTKALQNVNQFADNKAMQTKLVSQAQTLLNSSAKGIDKIGLTQLIKDLNAVPPSSKNAANSLSQLQTQLKAISNTSKEAQASGLGFGDAMTTAMTKYPIWLAASSVFLGIPKVVNGAIDVIVDLDTKLVNLQKVMNTNTNFENIMTNATESAKTFGQTISSVMDAYAEFARQGYGEDELPLLSDAALITANVGEMEAGKAAEYLTSTIVQYKLEAEDAMGVIDRWNNVSNNNATTVEKLAQGYARAGSVAKTWGLDMDQLNAIIGTVTAATKQSGNEVGNFIKNVLPRLTSAPAGDALNMVGVSLTDQNGQLKNALQIYKEVAVEYQKLDDLNKSIVAEGLAGKYHISRMSAFLDNMDMVDKMYQDSLNSANSASIENETYMKSLQARINLMKVEFEQLAIAVGEAFVTEGLIQFLKASSQMAQFLTSLTKNIGVLPVIFGTLGVAVMLLSTRMRTLGGALVYGTAQMRSQQLALLGLTKGMTGATVATTVFKRAMQSLLVASGVGIAIGLLGMAVEKLFSVMGEARQETEDFERRNQELMMSFKDNEGTVLTLADQYAELDAKMKSGTFDTTDVEKYTRVSNELAGLMPSLVVGEDQYGNKVLASSSYVKLKTEQLAEQLAMQERLDAQEAKNQAQDDYDTASKVMDDAVKKQKKAINELNNSLASMSGGFGFGNQNESDIIIKNLDDIIAKIAELEAKKNLSPVESLQLDVLKQSLSEIDQFSLKIEDARLTMSSSSAKMIEEMVKADEGMSASTRSMIMDISMLVATSESSASTIDNVLGGLGDKLESNGKFKSVLNEYGLAVEEYTKKIEQGLSGDELDKYKNKANSAYYSLSQSILAIAKDGGMSAGDINKLSTQLDISANSALNLDQAMEALTQSTGKTKEELQAQLLLNPNVADGLDSVGDSASDAADGMDELTTASEQLVGVSSSTLSSLREQIAVYEILTQQESLSEGQKTLLAKATEKLTDAYPSLVKGKELNIKAMSQEIEANEYLLSAIDRAAKGQLTSQESQTLNAALGTKARIEMMNRELQALQKVYDNQQRMMASLQQQAYKGTMDDDLAYLKYQKAYNRNLDIGSRIEQVKVNLEGLIPTFNKQASALDTTTKSTNKNTGATSKNTAANKANTSSYTNSIYVSDKFRQSLEKLNAQLEAQNKIKNRFPTHSKQYQDALRKEIKLLEQQRKLTQDQANSLSKQISSGKIKKTGIVDAGSTSYSTSGGGNASAKAVADYYLNNFRVTSSVGSKESFRKNAHKGLDLANGKQGDLVKAVQGGKVITATYSKSAGNWVVIQQDDGKVAKYMHMQSSPSVKAGQRVSTGQTLGKVGNTGQSTGAHLHLQLESGGKIVDPLQYLKTMQKTVNSVSATTKSKSQSDKTKSVAEGLQAVDQARSELLQLGADVDAINERIEQARHELVMAQIDTFEHKIAKQQTLIDKIANETYHMDDTTADYRNQLVKQRAAYIEMQRINESERLKVMELMKTQGITAATKAELQEKLNELMERRYEIAAGRDTTTMDIIMSEMKEYSDVLDELDHKMQMSQSNQSLYADDTVRFNSELNNQVDLMSRKKLAIEEQIKALEKYMNTEKLTVDQTKELNSQLKDLNLSYLDIQNSLQDLQDTYKDQIADSLASQQQKHLEGLRDSYARLNEELQNLTKQSPDFSMDVFADDLDNLFYELDKIDGIIRANPLFSTSTADSRMDLGEISFQIGKIASEIDKMTLSTSENQIELEALIRAQSEYANDILDQMTAIDNAIRDRDLEQKKVQDAIKEEIRLKEEQLKQLDEEYEKEDRLKRLKELEDEMAKVEADKRFSYITEDGQEILTYDKAKYDDLKKQRDELLEQYERDDIKDAMQDEIDRLQEKYDKTVDIHNAELEALELQRKHLNNLYNQLNNDIQSKLDKLQGLQEKNVDNLEKSWDDLIDGVHNGTITFDDMMSSWYANSLSDLAKYGVDVQKEIGKIKDAFGSITDIDKELDLPDPNTPAGSSPMTVAEAKMAAVRKKNAQTGIMMYQVKDKSGKLVWAGDGEWLNSLLDDGAKLVLNDGQFFSKKGGITKYHDGGIVGNSTGNRLTGLANSLFNVKPNEEIVKALEGELYVPPKNIPNLFTNVGNMVNDLMASRQSPIVSPVSETNYNIQSVTVKANNMDEFISSLNHYQRMR